MISLLDKFRMLLAELLANAVITLAPKNNEGVRLAGILVGYFVMRTLESPE